MSQELHIYRILWESFDGQISPITDSISKGSKVKDVIARFCTNPLPGHMWEEITVWDNAERLIEPRDRIIANRVRCSANPGNTLPMPPCPEKFQIIYRRQ